MRIQRILAGVFGALVLASGARAAQPVQSLCQICKTLEWEGKAEQLLACTTTEVTERGAFMKTAGPQLEALLQVQVPGTPVTTRFQAPARTYKDIFTQLARAGRGEGVDCEVDARTPEHEFRAHWTASTLGWLCYLDSEIAGCRADAVREAVREGATLEEFQDQFEGSLAARTLPSYRRFDRRDPRPVVASASSASIWGELKTRYEDVLARERAREKPPEEGKGGEKEEVVKKKPEDPDGLECVGSTSLWGMEGAVCDPVLNPGDDDTTDDDDLPTLLADGSLPEVPEEENPCPDGEFGDVRVRTDSGECVTVTTIDQTHKAPEDEVKVVRGQTVGAIAARELREKEWARKNLRLWGARGMAAAVIDYNRENNHALTRKYREEGKEWNPNRVYPDDAIQVPPKSWVENWYRNHPSRSRGRG